MNKYLILIVLHFIFCSFKDDMNNAHYFYEQIKTLRKYISQIKDINSTELKKNLKERLEKIIEELKEIHKNNKEFLYELNTLLLEMNNMINVESNTVLYFDKKI